MIAAYVAVAVAVQRTNSVEPSLVQLGFLSATTSVVICVFGVLFDLYAWNRPTLNGAYENQQGGGPTMHAGL